MSYFKDDKGKKSLTRILVFIACLTACALAIVQEILHALYETERSVAMVMALLAYAGLKKVFQKREERKI